MLAAASGAAHAGSTSLCWNPCTFQVRLHCKPVGNVHTGSNVCVEKTLISTIKKCGSTVIH